MKAVLLWVWFCAYLNCAGWVLSVLHQLNAAGYAVALLLWFTALLIWQKKNPDSLLPRIRWQKFRRRFHRSFPLAFLILAAMAFLGGALHPPTNYDALAYRVPRVLHWIAAGQWHWIHSIFPRINMRACHPHWHAIVRSALPQKSNVSLIPIELPYTTRSRSHAFESSSIDNNDAARAAHLVFSIRGDLRDYFAARRLFPLARIRISGWIRFFARKNSLIDFPYAHGLLPIENRYRSWAKLLGIPFSQIESTYVQNQAAAPKNRRVIIHLGAQWRSKQFPHVSELSKILQGEGYEVVLVAGQADLLPPNVTSESVVRAENENLVAQFRSAEQVITNDSGPMHLAAFLGCRTTTLVRTSSIEEWVPPATRVVAAEQTPRGYRQRKYYMSDEILPNWPSALSVAQGLTRA